MLEVPHMATENLLERSENDCKRASSDRLRLCPILAHALPNYHRGSREGAGALDIVHGAQVVSNDALRPTAINPAFRASALPLPSACAGCDIDLSFQIAREYCARANISRHPWTARGALYSIVVRFGSKRRRRIAAKEWDGGTPEAPTTRSLLSNTTRRLHLQLEL